MTTKIALFGITGNAGGVFAEEALKKGYKLQAMARSAGKVKLQHENLTVYEGNFDQSEVLQRTLAGVDNVVMMLGGPFNPKVYPKGFYTEATKKLIAEMKAVPSIKSFVVLTSAGSHAPGDKKGFLMEKIVGPLIMWWTGSKPNIDDHTGVNMSISQVQGEISFSTVVLRPMMMEMGDKANKAKVVQKMPMGTTPVKFSEIAEFAMESMADPSLHGTFPYIDAGP